MVKLLVYWNKKKTEHPYREQQDKATEIPVALSCCNALIEFQKLFVLNMDCIG